MNKVLKFLVTFSFLLATGVSSAEIRHKSDTYITGNLDVSDRLTVTTGATVGKLKVSTGSTLVGATVVGQDAAANGSAILEAYSTTKGFLPPRLTTTQRDAVSAPATGLMVYNTTTSALNVYSGAAWGAVGSGGGGGLFSESQNLLTNSSWETDTSNWTASGGSYARTTTAAHVTYPGIGAASWDPSASGQTLTSDSITITQYDGLSYSNGVLSCAVKTTATDLKMQVYDGTNVLSPNSTTDVVTPSSTGFVRYSVNFIFPSSGTVSARFYSQSNSAVAYIDQCYLGRAEGFNILSSSQAQLVGSGYFDTTASCSWSRTNAALGAFSTTSACPGPTVEFNPGPGTIQTTDADLPKFTVNNLPPGNYVVVFTGEVQNSASNVSALSINDGTTSSGRISQNASSGNFSLSGIFNYTTSGNRSFEIYAANNTGTVSVDASGGLRRLYFQIFRYPSSTEVGFKPDQTPASWSGYLAGAGGGWSTTSASYADPSVATTSTTLTELQNRNFGTVTAESTKLPGITFTPPRLGMYKICANVTGINNTDQAITYARLVDGSGGIITAGQGGGASGASGVTPLTLCGTKIISSIASTTFKVQLAASSGTASISQNSLAPIGWSILELDAPLAAPYLVGSVTSNSTGLERTERISVTSTCTSSPCTIANQSGSWVTSITRNGQGDYTLVIPSGIFSASPTCNWTVTNFSGNHAIGEYNAAAPTTIAVRKAFLNESGGAIDIAFDVQCQGAR